MSVTKKCGRRACAARIEIQGRHCSRMIARFKRRPELCRDCARVYCPECNGNLTWRQVVIDKATGAHHYVENPVNCERCGGTGMLSAKEISRNEAIARQDAHLTSCEICSREPASLAEEEFDAFVGDEKIGAGTREVTGRHEHCPVGLAILEELRGLGAVLDENGVQSGWDGRDWDGEPLDELRPGYREVVTARRELKDRGSWYARAVQLAGDDDDFGSEDDVHG